MYYLLTKSNKFNIVTLYLNKEISIFSGKTPKGKYSMEVREFYWTNDFFKLIT